MSSIALLTAADDTPEEAEPQGASRFQVAARSVLKFLRRRFGFQLWMTTRTEGEDWVVLEAEDSGYGVRPGDRFCWSDSFCSRMVRGEGPRIAPRAADVPVYAEAPIARQVAIGAYVGLPLTRPDGTLFGTLCAIDPAPQPERLAEERPLLDTLAGLLTDVLALELRSDEAVRRAERAEAEAMTDPLTGLYNRRGWDRLLAAEEERCRRYGDPACVFAIDLDGLKRANDTGGHHVGDDLIRRAASAVREAARGADVTARVGGDEFAVLAIGCRAEEAGAFRDRLRRTFADRGVAASVGHCPRGPGLDLGTAHQEADAAMYRDKRERRGGVGVADTGRDTRPL